LSYTAVYVLCLLFLFQFPKANVYLHLYVHNFFFSPIVVKDFQDYIEPEEGCQGSPQRRGPLTSGSDEENVALPLGDNVLTHNLGIPVLVVCTKVCPGNWKFDWVWTLNNHHLKESLRRFDEVSF
jgi:hypothetical protein